MSRRRLIVASALLAVVPSPAFAWDGVEDNTGDAVTIEEGQLVREGMDIDFWDAEQRAYRTMSIDTITRTGCMVLIEGADADSGDAVALTMQDDALRCR